MNNKGVFFLPVLVIAVIMLMMKGLNGNPTTLIIVAAGAFLLALAIRPKKRTSGGNTESTLSLLGDYSKDAFSYDEAQNAKFQSAITDFMNSMPKAATRKLEQLQSQCKTDHDTYAVSVALGMIKCYDDEHAEAIKLFNRAVVLHPTAELADAIGAAHQRIGELDEAIDSYEFALDLSPEKIDIRAKLATAFVGDGKFLKAIDQAQQVLDLQEDHASALATIAICHGVLDHEDLSSGYTAKAVEAGYSEEKITKTIAALKKKFKKTLEAMK